MTLAQNLRREYVPGLIAAAPLGALIGTAVAAFFLLGGNSDWRSFATPASAASFVLGFAGLGVLVAVVAALGAVVALVLLERKKQSTGRTRIASVAGGSAIALVAAGIIYGLLFPDPAVPYLVVFMTVLAVITAAISAAVIEGRAARTAPERL